MSDHDGVRCMLMRGGTSKGASRRGPPADPATWDVWLSVARLPTAGRSTVSAVATADQQVVVSPADAGRTSTSITYSAGEWRRRACLPVSPVTTFCRHRAVRGRARIGGTLRTHHGRDPYGQHGGLAVATFSTGRSGRVRRRHPHLRRALPSGTDRHHIRRYRGLRLRQPAADGPTDGHCSRCSGHLHRQRHAGGAGGRRRPRRHRVRDLRRTGGERRTPRPDGTAQAPRRRADGPRTSPKTVPR
jgi:hypothetical protein